MLLDRIIPSYQFAERHAATLPAPPAVVYRALWQVDFARSPVIRFLFGVRGLGPRLRRGRGRMHARLDDFLRAGFLLLDERPGEEVVLGAAWGRQRSAVNASRFARYWLVVGPFSVLIGCRMLAVPRATVARAASPDADAGRIGDGAVDVVPTGVLHPPAPSAAAKGRPNP